MRSLLLLPFLVACGGGGAVTANAIDPEDIDEGDTTPPTIAYDQEADWAYMSEDFVVEATVTDDTSLYIVSLYYKKETGDWDNKPMMDSGGGLYSAIISSSDLGSAGMYYYIEALDTSQNTAWSPDEGPSDPWHVRLSE